MLRRLIRVGQPQGIAPTFRYRVGATGWLPSIHKGLESLCVTSVINSLHQQTGGQPFLVNRLAQILTEEMNIPRSKTITNAHFEKALQRILNEENVHLSHLTTNIRQNPRFESLLMRICSYHAGQPFNIRNELISE
jgi:hypothetical protein